MWDSDLSEELTPKLFSFCCVSSCRRLFCIVIPEPVADTRTPHPRHPFPTILPKINPPDTTNTIAGYFSVRVILAVRCLPQVIPRVVRPVRVQMIYDTSWPLTRHYCPRQSVSFEQLPVNHDNHIPRGFMQASRRSPYPHSSSRLCPPDEQPRLRVICQDPAKFFNIHCDCFKPSHNKKPEAWVEPQLRVFFDPSLRSFQN